MTLSALIFDFGGPVLLTPFELRAVGEHSMGLPAGSLHWTGPFDPDSDLDWRRFQAGEITERDYWAIQAAHYAELTGQPASMPDLMAHLYSGTEEELIRPGASTLLADAQRASIPVGLLTNDLTTFHDAQWVERMTVLSRFDCVVDGKADGVMKPDAAAYHLICQRMNIAPTSAVFIDDQPVNLAGAQAVGMTPVHLDPRSPEDAFNHARELLGLSALAQT